MSESLLQLAKSLKFRRIPDLLEQELVYAQQSGCGYGELLARLFRAEMQAQQDAALDRRIVAARFPELWDLGTFPWKRQPGVKQAVIKELASLDFLARSENLVFIGDSGVGKTGLASGLLLKAIQAGFRGRFIKAQDLFDEMYSTVVDKSSRRMVERLARLDLLMVDDLGYLNLAPEQTNIFFRLVEERYVRRKPMLITTNLEYDDWSKFLKNKDMTPALVDRIQHRCHTIRIKGPTLRSNTEA